MMTLMSSMDLSRLIAFSLQQLLEPLSRHQQRPVAQDVPRVELLHGRQRRAVDVARRALEVLVAAVQREQAAPVDAQRLVHLRDELGLGLVEADPVDDADVVALDLAQDRAARRELALLLRQALAPLLRALLLRVPAPLLDRVADPAGARVAGALLAEHLSGRAGDLAARQRLHGALALVRVVVHQRLLEQRLAHLAAELGLVDLDRLELLAGLVVNRYFDHLGSPIADCRLPIAGWNFRSFGNR